MCQFLTLAVCQLLDQSRVGVTNASSFEHRLAAGTSACRLCNESAAPTGAGERRGRHEFPDVWDGEGSPEPGSCTFPQRPKGVSDPGIENRQLVHGRD